MSELAAIEAPVKDGAPVARVRRDDGTVGDVRAPVPGSVIRRAVESGAHVEPGDAVIVLGPDARHALNAAGALALVGTRDDAEILSMAAAPQSQFGEDVKAAARQALDAIRARTK